MLALAVGIGVAQNSDIFAQLVVDDDGKATFNNCNAQAPTFMRIQDAVNAAPAGTTIRVCPGTYPEQVRVETAAKSNITLVSFVRFAAIIKAPPVVVEPGDIVTIDNAQNVTLNGFTVSGPFPDVLFCSVELRSGVRVVGGGSANILRNRITEIRSASPAFRGCQNGLAVAVGRQFVGETGRANILDNLIDKYQKGGIYVDNVGSAAQIFENEIRGDGIQNVIAQNGIQISRGATADIRRNLITDHVYINPPLTIPDELTSATAVLIFGAGAVNADRNTLRRNQDGFAVFTALLGNVAISNNTIIGGISSFPAALGTLNFGDGIYMNTDTANNRLLRNFLRDNAEHDCHDESAGPNNPPANVANIWRGNDGRTENRPGLCRERGNGGDDQDDDDDDDDNDDDDNDDDNDDDDDDN